MNKEEVQKLCDELLYLARQGPGPNESGLARVGAIARQFMWHERATTYLNEKARTVEHDFKIWFSVRKWKAYGEDSSRFRGQLFASISKLRGACDSGLAWTRATNQDPI